VLVAAGWKLKDVVAASVIHKTVVYLRPSNDAKTTFLASVGNAFTCVRGAATRPQESEIGLTTTTNSA
jgi:hypothetical protein